MYRSYKLEQQQQQESSQTSETNKEMAGKNSLKTIVFLGTTREGRMSERVGKFIKKHLEQANHEVEIFDPVVMKFPLLEKPLHWYQDRSQAPDWLVAADKKLQEADAVVLVSCEYNHSIPPALSNMLDHFPLASYAFKPSGIVCYSMGPFGGMRAAMQLRCMTGELGCISVSNIFGIPEVHKALGEDGTPLNDFMVPGATRLVQQLDWHARAMKAHREAFGVPK